MRIFITLFISLTTLPISGQINFELLMALENKSFNEVQAFFAKDYSIIDDLKEYQYIQIKECNPPLYNEDNCHWKCAKPDFLNSIKSKYPIENIQFKNYEIWLYLKSVFAESYDFKTKKASTFIEISERKSWSNDNCNNEFEIAASQIPIIINIQFSDINDWKMIKKSVAENATFQKTYRLNDESPIELRYGIRRKFINDRWTGTYITLYEDESTYNLSISFNSFGVE